MSACTPTRESHCGGLGCGARERACIAIALPPRARVTVTTDSVVHSASGAPLDSDPIFQCNMASFALVLATVLATAVRSGGAVDHGSSASNDQSALDLSLDETVSPNELARLRSTRVDQNRVQGSGVNYCKFANGTRQVPLAADFFGPEPCVFGDGMVLRASDSAGGAGASAGAVIWGFGAAAEKVALTIDGTPSGSATSDANGRWEITVKVPASAKPSVLEFSGASKQATLNNVLFGDVWLCSGQSNMDFSVAASGGGGCFAQNETVALAASGKYNDIRLMHGGAANGHWWNASSNNGSDVAHFSAVCFLSALAMKQHIPSHKDRPIGLVQSSVGGKSCIHHHATLCVWTRFRTSCIVFTLHASSLLPFWNIYFAFVPLCCREEVTHFAHTS